MEQTKPWYLSKTVWGILIAFAGFIANQFFGSVIPDVSSEIVEIIGMAIALIGRFKASSKIA